MVAALASLPLELGLHRTNASTPLRVLSKGGRPSLESAEPAAERPLPVSGAKKDMLQEAIALVRKSVTELALQFKNFRD